MITQENICVLSNLRVQTLKQIVKEQNHVEDFHNRGRVKSPLHVIGDLVMVSRQATDQLRESKMLRQHKDP